MKENLRKLAVTVVACTLIPAFLVACGTTSGQLASFDDGNTLVFGKLELVKNGEDVALGDGFFANHAALRFEQLGSGEEFVGKVGRGGEFAWYLGPGEYHVSVVSFGNQGERVDSDVSLNFHVAPQTEAVYVGTVVVQTRFHTGYYGTDAVVGTVVRNECARDCAPILARHGLADAGIDKSILHRPGRVARNY